jgi:protease-4
MKKKTPGTIRYLELNLGNSSGPANRFTSVRLRSDTELETLRILKRAARDKKIQGLFINTSGFSANREYLWELRKALEVCKSSGKKILAYFDNADLDFYCFLSMAHKIIMDKAGTLNFLGYSWGRFFVKESLEKLGVGFRELRYLDYKSANETFSRTSISEADREQYGAYLDEIFNLTKTTIMQNRSLREEDFDALLKEGILLSPGDAKSRALVDALGREDAVKKAIKEIEFGDPGIENSSPGDKEEGKLIFISAGNPVFSFYNKASKTSRYTGGRAKGFRVPEIAVIHARGTTDLERGMEARAISRLIYQLAEKPRIKALVIRIDSPGGSAVAADFIAAAIQEVKKEIPVVVSLGQVAASGGYWAAMYASHVCVSPYTLTGSIGVISGWFYDKGFNAKLGLGFEALTRGDHADLGAGIILPQRDLSDDEESQFRCCLLDLYGEFVNKAAEARNMKIEDLEPLARGRVYSGLASQGLGLTDSLGGYLEALETARSLSKIPVSRKVRIREYPRPKFCETMMAKIFSSAIIPGRSFHFKMAFMGEKTPELWEDLSYRFSCNGHIMPLLPLVLE